jgi:hypothetical protein
MVDNVVSPVQVPGTLSHHPVCYSLHGLEYNPTELKGYAQCGLYDGFGFKCKSC